MTTDNSPNSLRPQVQTNNKHKKFYYGIFALGVMIIAILVYNIHIAPSKKQEEANKQVNITEQKDGSKPMLLADGSGLATQNNENSTKGGISSPSTKQSENQSKAPIIIVRGTPQEVQNRDEIEQVKKHRIQGFLSALKAPILSKQYKNNEGKNNQENVAGADVKIDKDKKDTAWISKDKRTRGQDFEIKTGAVIPAIMVTGINSELAGSIIAQVSQNIYDSSTGEYVLIPQGSKLFGTYDSKTIYGQNRVLVSWNRIIYPDGSAITLPAMPGADMAGNSGFNDKVNNHYLRTFGSAILMSLIVGGTAHAIDGGSDENSNENSLKSQMTASLAQQIGATSTSILEKNLNIKPTLKIRSGYQFNIVLTKDLVFETPYRAWR